MAQAKRVEYRRTIPDGLPVACGVSEGLLHRKFPFIQSGSKLAHASHRRERVERRPSDFSGLHGTHEPPPPFPSKMLSDLTKAELVQVLEILHYTMEAKTGEDVHRILQLLQEAVPCTRVIGGIAEYTPTGDFKEFSRVLNVSYSNDWLYAYCKNEYAAVDPVLLHLPTSLPTLIWKQTFAAATSPRQLEFIEEACAFGLTNGITTGKLDRKRGVATFFSFAGGDANGTVRYKDLIEYLVPHFHRVLTANTHTPLSEGTKGLSPREITVLLWMKEGKTNWEIAHIVGVSERTVRFHVESIFVKLNASSRAQAVAVALEHGLLPTD
ncbi:helix-turn-helix transcriptional regulator [Nitrospira moscoviensis]|uniref:Transcriptional regulator (Modular protein) n=1 Tax=Nitrospira moscoviensis TaxID=42253 RepID=A0A0K2G7M7_NITMO|nr:LuxR family transcriptional regulator [Nitrospira moscoviensis]ALA56953.1 Transcriptional regulator (modular protein) [Nitrospira moscoviensis]